MPTGCAPWYLGRTYRQPRPSSSTPCRMSSRLVIVVIGRSPGTGFWLRGSLHGRRRRLVRIGMHVEQHGQADYRGDGKGINDIAGKRVVRAGGDVRIEKLRNQQDRENTPDVADDREYHRAEHDDH